MNRIHFDNDIMTSKMHLKGEHHLRYHLKIWNKKGAFGIINDISENIYLVQVMDTLVNMNHAISIVSYWIFYNFSDKRIIGYSMFSFCW